MDDIQHPAEFYPSTTEQICDLADAVRGDLAASSREQLRGRSADLLEGVSGFRQRNVDTRLIELARPAYSDRPANS
ncbi:hypothetical protein FOC34_17030 [Burkholderia multivorans]|uniref:hypothetical protein n=1 Tax=Burkholderia multivorans TaxID=87883 RepID=UPI0012DDCA27|nr:hypothetical protein [Burkholderia multivorans]QGR86931.1 hypothetical protein FOC34_17030 [Burkholderia multivorans]